MPERKLGDRIFKYRKAKKLSQEEFAYIIGVSFVTLNRWENDLSMPRGLQKRAIERILLTGENKEQTL